MLFCRYCGGKTPDDSLFCAHCGHPMQPSLEPTTHALPSGDLTPPSQPLQHVPSHDSSHEEDEEQQIIPPVVPPEVPTTGSIPSVAGTPQIGTVPSIPAVAGTVATTLTAGTLVKVVVVLAVCAAVIFTGVKAIPPILYHPTTTPVTKTLPVPPTQTSCPAPGTARAAVTAPLVLGKHQNLVYTTREGTLSDPTSGSLKRYDVTTGHTTDIMQLDTSVANAQISADGQWVLFATAASSKHEQAAIQMIRMDGQGLQTLYCAPPQLDPTNFNSEPINSIAWSSDQKLAIFSEGDISADNNNPPSLYLLNLTHGTVLKELLPIPGSSTIYLPNAWIDNTHVALSSGDLSGNSNEQGIYVLDTNNGANQHSTNLQLISKGVCAGFDISSDRMKFFLNSCATPNSISMLPVTGGTAHTVFTIQSLQVDTMRVISKTTLLVYLIDFAATNVTSQSGLYKLQMNGTGLTKLFGSDVFPNLQGRLGFNQSSLYTWSVASRDGSMYSLLTAGCGNACHFTLFFGSLSGGSPTTIADGGNGTGFDGDMVGWTTM